jgi:hypothetical protein
MNLIPLIIALSVASAFGTRTDVNLITGTAFLADVVKQNESFMDGPNECIGVGLGAFCRSEIKQDEQFCVSVVMWPFPMIRKEFYFRNTNANIKDAKVSFWGASFDPKYSNENDGIYLVNTATVLSDTGCTKF